MSKNTILVLVLILLCIVIAVIPLVLLNSDFGGADGAAEDVIAEVDPDYQPWAESLFELPGGETESLLFCLQAAMGALVLGGGFGYFIGRKKGIKMGMEMASSK